MSNVTAPIMQTVNRMALMPTMTPAIYRPRKPRKPVKRKAITITYTFPTNYQRHNCFGPIQNERPIGRGWRSNQHKLKDGDTLVVCLKCSGQYCQDHLPEHIEGHTLKELSHGV